jgi:hypothetical protein
VSLGLQDRGAVTWLLSSGAHSVGRLAKQVAGPRERRGRAAQGLTSTQKS